MSDGTRKKLSGAQYKKRRLEKDAEKEKLSGALTKFLKHNCSTPNPSPSNVELVAEPLVIDDQQPSTSGAHISLNSEVSNSVSNDGEGTAPTIDIDFPDPATWPNLLSHRLIELIVTKGAVQIIENFPVDETGRKFSATQYMRKLPNGENVNRDWLVYSKKINAVFCIFCKVFSSQSHKLISGYSNWRHLSVNISRHENSMEHMKSAQKWYELKLRLVKECTIDKEQQKHFEIEKKTMACNY